jgi:hypothetical protein
MEFIIYIMDLVSWQVLFPLKVAVSDGLYVHKLKVHTNFRLFIPVGIILGLPNDLYVYWQQYPWIFGVGLCKIRALVSEM